MLRVIYLSGPFLLGEKTAKFLTSLDCKIIRSSLSEERFTDYPEDYDLGISFLYQYKVPADQLTHTWINFHPAPLPRYRGRNVAYQAIINGETTFGGTIHYMDEEFDTGEIIEVAKFPILEEDTAGDLTEKTHQVLFDLFRKYVPRFLSGEKIPSFPQREGIYYKRLPIDDFIPLSEDQKRRVRAVTCHPKFHAKVEIAGRVYRLIPEETGEGI